MPLGSKHQLSAQGFSSKFRVEINFYYSYSLGYDSDKKVGSMKQHTNAPGVPAPVGAYSQAIQSGSLLFCSGQIGISSDTGVLVQGSFADEVKQVLENIDGVLRHAGSSPERIISTSIFLISMDDFKQVNEQYASFVSASCPPARQTVAVKELPLGARVEISVIAEV